ncbi:MAG: hypothetical protein PHT19_04165 [Methylococcus sp.]|nr:hypothetical protein [Methylococcus sp.]
MFKKILHTLAFLSLSISLALTPLAARAAEPNGLYTPSGPMALKLDVPGIINISVSSPNVGVLGGLLGLAFEFDPPASTPNNFVMTINNPLDSSTPIQLRGTWSMLTASKFSVDMNFQGLIALIEQLGGTVTVTSNSFTGKVLATGNIKGAYALGVRISIMGISIKLKISGSYVGKPAVMISSQTGELGSPASSSNTISLDQFILGLVEKIRQQKLQ